MSATTKIVYETKPWLTGEHDLPMNTNDLEDITIASRNTIPARDPTGPGMSNYIQLGYSRSVSILFTATSGETYTGAGRTVHAAVLGWVRTADATPIYIPVPMIHVVWRSGDVGGFAGSEGYGATTFICDMITIDDDNFKPSGLGGTPTFSYNHPNAPGTTSEQDNGSADSHAILRMENGWGLDGFQIFFHKLGSGYNAGFLYSLA